MKADSSMKKIHVREAYRSYVEDFYKLTLGRIGNKQKSEGLARFYLERVYNLLHSPISSEDLDEGFVDASDDLGVDFIYRDDQTVLMLQSKYMGEGSSVDLDKIIHFQSVFERLTDPEFKKNQRLEEIFAEVDLEHDAFLMKFVTLGDISGQARTQIASDPHYPMPGLADRVEYQYLDAEQLRDELRDASTLAGGIPGEHELVAVGRRGKRSPVIELEDKDFPSCVLVVDARQLVELYRKFQNRLFTLNIRNYLGRTATNKLLRETLEREPTHFYHFNNGISCLASVHPETQNVVLMT